MTNNITPELIRAALAFIPANLPRDEWARVGMAIKSEFPDGPGFDLFIEWSATADGYDYKAAQSTWRSIKAGGGVGVGTLLHLAKEHGFVLPKGTQAPVNLAPEALAQRERERVERLRKEQLRIEAAHASAATEAAALWQGASETGESPYLARKGVQPHGVRFGADGWLLVPLRDAAGVLCNVQRIAPAKPGDDGPDKLFLKGGRKSGLWHMVGDVGGDAGPAVLLVAEGYATAASVHEATSTHADTLKARTREASDALAAQLIPEAASGQVERVGARFALAGAAGELATAAGLTGWPAGESERAARACFNAWLAARGGIGNGEVVAMLRAVRRFLETHGEGRFAMWHRSADDHAPKTLQRAGVRRMLNEDGEPIKTNSQHAQEFGDRMPAALGEGVSFEYFILAETFRAEVCQGFDYQAVCRVLLDHGCLTPDNGRPFDCRPRLPGVGKLVTCYRITPAIFGLDL